MDHYTLIFVSDERSPVKRFQIPRSFVKRAVYGAAAAALVFLLLSWDYWRVRSDNAELEGLRVEAAEQREQIRRFETTLAEARVELERVRDLERKVRIIANLPGAANVGGEGVTELTPLPEGSTGQPILPAGVPLDPNAPVPTGQGGGSLEEEGLTSFDEVELRERGLSSDGAQHVHHLGAVASSIGSIASVRGVSLDELLIQLEDKRVRLESMPSVWPARGWLTSRFGPRVSPFTGRAHHHAGIDIAAAKGTPVIAPARGRVAYAGRKGPLGNALVIDHGFGVRTVYGHNDKVLVEVGQTVERGDRVAEIGNTGRSTGPHLHYVVQVNGKSKDPLDYIFD